MQHLWLIPAFPLAGFLVNGLAGRRASRSLVNAVAIGTRGAVVSLGAQDARRARRHGDRAHRALLHLDSPAAACTSASICAVDRLTAVMLLVVTGVGLLIHIYAAGYMAHEGGYYRFFAYLNLFMFFMLMLVLARELPAAVRGLGRRGLVQLPADRLLLPAQERHRRRQEGVHRESHRRLRLFAGHVPHLHRSSARWISLKSSRR